MKRLMILAVPALMLAGCGSGEDEVASGTVRDGNGQEASYRVTTDGDDGSKVEIKTAEGTTTFNSGNNAPVSLPYGLPLYPGAKVTSNSEMNAAEGGQKAVILGFESADAPEKIADFYRQKAQGAGLKISGEVKTPESIMIGGEHEGSEKAGDKGGFQLTVSKKDDGSGSTAMLFAGSGQN